MYDRDIFNRNVEVGQNVGSGVIFDKKGYIVTNNHVVGNNRQVNVALSDGQVVTGKVIGTDAVTDLAVVKIPGSDKLPVAEFGNSDSLQPGETAVAIGNPLGLEFRGTVTVGVISALNRTLDDVEQQIKLIQTDAAINPGNSGGALCTADGKVIGINSAKIAKAGVEGMGFAIPINQVKTIVSQLISNGHVTRPYLGLYGIDKTLAARNGISWDHNGGIYVYKIADGSPLDGSDIVRGDYIMQINGKATNSLSELRNVMMNYKPGDKVTITYEHSGHTRTAVVVLGEDDGK